MLIYNDNSIKSLFSDSNFTDDNFANVDEDENEIMDCSSFQDIYPINNPSTVKPEFWELEAITTFLFSRIFKNKDIPIKFHFLEIITTFSLFNFPY